MPRFFRHGPHTHWQEMDEDEAEFDGPPWHALRQALRRGGPWGWRGGPWGRRGDHAWFAPGRHDHFGGPFGPGGPFGGGPFGDDPFDRGGPGRRRQRRGDIKYALLELLAEQPRHGYELIKELEQRYGGFYRPSPGSVYPTLQLLEDEGHLTSEMVAGKRVYTITESGRQLLSERQQQPDAEDGPPWRRGGWRGDASPELGELRQSFMGLAASVMQAARHGSPEQVRAVLELIDATRREIYAILAKTGGE